MVKDAYRRLQTLTDAYRRIRRLQTDQTLTDGSDGYRRLHRRTRRLQTVTDAYTDGSDGYRRLHRRLQTLTDGSDAYRRSDGDGSDPKSNSMKLQQTSVDASGLLMGRPNSFHPEARRLL